LAIAMKGIAFAGPPRKMVSTIASRFLAELGPDSPKPITPA
jgi:hypothetical protein